VVETFNVLSISSLDWGLLGGISLLRFNVDFAKNMPSSYWFRSGGKWNRICTHREFKPGDDPSEYQYLLDEAIPYSQVTPGAVTTAEPTQRYIIVLLLPGTIEVNVTTDGTSSALPNQSADVVWYNADRSRLGGSNGGISFPYFDSKDLAAGVYYIDVAGRGGVGQTGTYNIRVDYINSEKEPNNTMSEAQLLVSGLTVRGASITAQDSVDTYRYELAQPGRLTVNVTRDTLQYFYVTWFDADGKQICKDYYGSSYNSKFMDLEAGVYFIEITPYSSYSGTYNLRGDFAAAGNNEREPNNTLETAQLLTSEQMVRGFISYQDSVDTYRYELAQPGRLTMNVTRDTLQYFYVTWFDADGKQMRKDSHYSSYSSYSQSMDLEVGVYFIEITTYSDNSGTYNLRGDFAAAGNNEREPNNTRSEAQPLRSGQMVRGFISYQDSVDTYRYELTQPGRLTMNVTRDTLQYFYVTWFDVDGKQIYKDSHYSSTYNKSMDLEAGIYFIEITTYSDYSGTYELTITSG